MTEYLLSLSIPYKIIWFVAITSSVMFLVYLTKMFNINNISKEPKWLSFKNVVSFIMVFSWVFIASRGTTPHLFNRFIWSVLCGTTMTVIMTIACFGYRKMQSNKTVNLHKALGKCGRVSKTIPADFKVGEVQVVFEGEQRTVLAISENELSLPVGSYIQVVGIDELIDNLPEIVIVKQI